MKLSKTQLRRVINEALDEMSVKPPKGTSLKTRSFARTASAHPGLEDAIQNLVGEMETALEEVIGPDPQDDMLQQSLHTDFHNDLMNFIDEWIDTYVQEYDEMGQIR